jgi:hypothetical protein
MTIPTYSMLDRKMLPPVFPPLAPSNPDDGQFDFTYTGSAAIEARIRSAMSAFARSDYNFWKYTAVVFVAAVATGIIGGARYPIAMPVLSLILFLLIGGIVPRRILRQIDVAAGVYAVEGETYRSFFDDEAIWWAVPGGTYRIPFAAISRVFTTNGVTILGVGNSRAICVLPSELLPANFSLLLRKGQDRQQ